MEQLLRIVLPGYFLIYFGLAFILKSVVVAKRTGKNPLVIPRDDSAYGLIGKYFKLTLVLMFAYTVVFSAVPPFHQYFMWIPGLNQNALKYGGLAMLLLSLLWTVLAQRDMRNSWRIGIDKEQKTELITGGLFRISRNPIFLGMLMSLLGLFLVTPNGLALLFLIVGYILIQIQIRLEEEFLIKQHGDVYVEYMKKTRRLI